jgi:hypothetical protein
LAEGPEQGQPAQYEADAPRGLLIHSRADLALDFSVPYWQLRQA